MLSAIANRIEHDLEIIADGNANQRALRTVGPDRSNNRQFAGAHVGKQFVFGHSVSSARVRSNTVTSEDTTPVDRF